MKLTGKIVAKRELSCLPIKGLTETHTPIPHGTLTSQILCHYPTLYLTGAVHGDLFLGVFGWSTPQLVSGTLTLTVTNSYNMRKSLQLVPGVLTGGDVLVHWGAITLLRNSKLVESKLSNKLTASSRRIRDMFASMIEVMNRGERITSESAYEKIFSANAIPHKNKPAILARWLDTEDRTLWGLLVSACYVMQASANSWTFIQRSIATANHITK